MVFSSMVGLEVVGGEPITDWVTEYHCSISSMVGLAGQYAGIVSLHCPQSLGLKFTGSMLGVPVDEIGDDVTDAVGELANMVAGNMKQLLSPGGMDVHLSIPTVIYGDRYVIDTILNEDSLLVTFTYEDESFTIGLSIKKDD
jgi:chemotaxis protein CheX